MEKSVIRTEAAPAPFQGAPYNQAIGAGDFVFVAGQLGLKPGDTAAIEGEIAEQTEQALATWGRSSRRRAARSKLVKTTVFLQRLDDFQAMNEVYAATSAPAARPLDVRGREAPRRARSSRSRRSRTSEPGRAAPPRMATAIRRYVRSLGLDAYVVGGAVRDELLGIPHADEDFLVPGLDQAGLRAALEPHGRVDDMEVHGQLVGVRFHPRDPAVRGGGARGHRADAAAAPSAASGRGTATSRSSRIPRVVDRGRHGAPRLHRQRDGERLETDELVDPFGGRVDLERGSCARSRPRASGGSPAASSAACASSRSSTSRPPRDPRADAARPAACGTSRRSGSAAGAGGRAGELSKLLLGRRPRACLAARAGHRCRSRRCCRSSSR